MKTPFTRFVSTGAWLIAAAVLLAGVSARAAANPFEGRVTLALSSAKEAAHHLNYAIKGQRLRMDLEDKGKQMSTIMDLSARTVTMLMHEDKMYMVMKMPEPKDVAAKTGKEPGKDVDIEDTGKTDKILGYLCHQFLVKDGKSVTELWMAEGLGMFMGLGSGGNQMGGGPFGGKKRSAASAQWEEAFKGKEGFPLRVITRDAAGKESFKMEATKIEKGGVTDADFTPPEDYQKFEMPNFGGMNPFKQN